MLNAGIGKNVFGSFDMSIQQPTFSIIVKNADSDKKELFIKTVYETLNKLVTEELITN